MRKPGGVLIATDVNGSVDETDSFSCGHCNRVVLVPVKCNPDDLGGHCRVCMAMICPACVSTGKCDPLEEKLARAEASYEARRSYDLL